MHFAKAIFAGSLAALAVIASPALAKSSDRQKTEEKSTTSPACQAYQQTQDGSWVQLPCGEMGASGSTQHRPAPKSADDDDAR